MRIITIKIFVRLIKIIIIYTIAAILCSIFNIVKDKITVKTILINYFSFKAAPYGWYVGMYMGLYLMIPFLNKAWNGFEEKSKNNYYMFVFNSDYSKCI